VKTLFFISAAAFAAAALTWFFVWAIWIHAPQGWHGAGHGPVAAARRAHHPDAPSVRHLTWYRRLQLATLTLLGLSVGLLAGWHYAGGE
jgi:hypothetical protein